MFKAEKSIFSAFYALKIRKVKRIVKIYKIVLRYFCFYDRMNNE